VTTWTFHVAADTYAPAIRLHVASGEGAVEAILAKEKPEEQSQRSLPPGMRRYSRPMLLVAEHGSGPHAVGVQRTGLLPVTRSRWDERLARQALKRLRRRSRSNSAAGT
jgi:hypothetical protein